MVTAKEIPTTKYVIAKVKPHFKPFGLKQLLKLFDEINYTVSVWFMSRPLHTKHDLSRTQDKRVINITLWLTW